MFMGCPDILFSRGGDYFGGLIHLLKNHFSYGNGTYTRTKQTLH